MAPPRKDTHLSNLDRIQKRKEAHCSIEKRRRLLEKECISKLKSLVPSSAAQSHLHQLTILENAVDYIKYLKSLNDDCPMSPFSQFEGFDEEVHVIKPMYRNAMNISYLLN